MKHFNFFSQEGYPLQFYQVITDSPSVLINCFDATVPAGFPKPTEDYIEFKQLDLNEYLVQRASTTFLVRVSGVSMLHAGILDNSLLVIDKSIRPQNGMVVLAVIHGEFTVKTYREKNGQFWLMPANDAFQPIKVTEEMGFMVWGVVKNVINDLVPR